jgi:hypothetical protein
MVWLSVSDQDAVDVLAAFPEITFIDVECTLPEGERIVEEIDFTVNQINQMKSEIEEPGQGTGVVVQENAIDSDDIDLIGKTIKADFTSPIVETHATTMSTIIGGLGNSYFLGEGVSPYADLISADFRFLLPIDINLLPDHFRLTNHSYGTLLENFYGLEARSFDSQVYNNQEVIHVFSSGNEGESTPGNGNYNGVQAFANLTGNFKQAKNILVVGAIDSFNMVEQRSSRGPAYDGRVKPDVVAYGEDGSSGAAAITSGVIACLQSVFLEKYDAFPSFDVIKSILIASANDLLTPGPDFISGYGSLNAIEALSVLKKEQFVSGIVNKGEDLTIVVEIPDHVNEVRFALSWIDAPASENDHKSLINDLNMDIRDQSMKQYLPLVLNAYPLVDSLSDTAIEGIDTINTSELIIIDEPADGPLEIIISGNQLINEAIPFTLAYSMVVKDTLSWSYPTKKDILESETPQFVRWKSTLDDSRVELSWKKIDDPQWTFIDSVDTRLEGYYWNTPLGIEKIHLKISGKSTEYISDTFVVSSSIVLEANNLCDEMLTLEWEAATGAEYYELSYLQNDKMIPFLTTIQEHQEIDLTQMETDYFAVRPVGRNDIKGRRSRTIKYQFQNPTCYVNSFTGVIIDNVANLELKLSTLISVDKIKIFKVLNGSDLLLTEIDFPISTTYSYLDENLLEGLNDYYASIILQDGSEFFSDVISLEYLPDGLFRILQNPVMEGDDIIIDKNPQEEASISIFNTLGYKVITRILRGGRVFIDTSDLPAGAYPYIIFREDRKLKEGIFIIL